MHAITHAMIRFCLLQTNEGLHAAKPPPTYSVRNQYDFPGMDIADKDVGVLARMPGMVRRKVLGKVLSRNASLQCVHCEQQEALLAQVWRSYPEKGCGVYLLGVQLRRCETGTVYEDGGDDFSVVIIRLSSFQVLSPCILCAWYPGCMHCGVRWLR